MSKKQPEITDFDFKDTLRVDTPENIEKTEGTPSQQFGVIDQPAFSNANKRNLRIALQGNIVFDGNTLDIEHNLGFPPLHLVYVEINGTGFPDGYVQVPYFINDGVNNPRILVNASKEKISLFRTFTSAVVNVQYFIFESSLL